MLNLIFAMVPQRRLLRFFILTPFLGALMIYSLAVTPVAWANRLDNLAQTPTVTPLVMIAEPLPGEALQGSVEITGFTDVPGFRSAEITFAYQDDPTSSWFLIQQGTKPVKEGILATWDTTTISDGQYRLRIRVFLQDGKVQESQINGLRVRNYTVIETSTPEAHLAGLETTTPTGTPLADFKPISPEATPFPTNPAQINLRNLGESAFRGMLLIIGVIVFAFVYVGARAIFRH
jgi:hypothetical protein